MLSSSGAARFPIGAEHTLMTSYSCYSEFHAFSAIIRQVHLGKDFLSHKYTNCLRVELGEGTATFTMNYKSSILS